MAVALPAAPPPQNRYLQVLNFDRKGRLSDVTERLGICIKVTNVASEKTAVFISVQITLRPQGSDVQLSCSRV